MGIRKSQVVWAVREEMALTLEDVLARRTRALFLDVNECLKIAAKTAEIMAIEMNKDDLWMKSEIKNLEVLAENYLPKI